MINKLKKASQQTGIQRIAIAGGVSANSGLRKALQAAQTSEGWEVFIPELEYCTDNAAMIAMNAYYKYLNSDFCGQDVAPKARYHF